MRCKLSGLDQYRRRIGHEIQSEISHPCPCYTERDSWNYNEIPYQRDGFVMGLEGDF